MKPYTCFAGGQATIFIFDSSDNSLKFKAVRDIGEDGVIAGVL